MLPGPCLRDTQAAVCATVNGNCPAANASDPALSGGLTTNKTITLGGDPNTTYAIVLHVQGEVESKNYNGGTDLNATGSSPTLNGWRYPAGTTNPTPSNTNAYNVYMLRVVNPGVDRAQRLHAQLDGWARDREPHDLRHGLHDADGGRGGCVHREGHARRSRSSPPTRTAA